MLPNPGTGFFNSKVWLLMHLQCMLLVDSKAECKLSASATLNIIRLVLVAYTQRFNAYHFASKIKFMTGLSLAIRCVAPCCSTIFVIFDKNRFLTFFNVILQDFKTIQKDELAKIWKPMKRAQLLSPLFSSKSPKVVFSNIFLL